MNFKPYTVHESVSVAYSATTTDPMGDLRRENDKLRLLVRDLWLVAGLQDAIGELAIHAHGTDWRTFEERVSEALGLEEDA